MIPLHRTPDSIPPCDDYDDAIGHTERNPGEQGSWGVLDEYGCQNQQMNTYSYAWERSSINRGMGFVRVDLERAYRNIH